MDQRSKCKWTKNVTHNEIMWWMPGSPEVTHGVIIHVKSNINYHGRDPDYRCFIVTAYKKKELFMNAQFDS